MNPMYQVRYYSPGSPHCWISSEIDDFEESIADAKRIAYVYKLRVEVVKITEEVVYEISDM